MFLNGNILFCWILTCGCVSYVELCFPMRDSDTTTIPVEGGQPTTTEGVVVSPSTEPIRETTSSAGGINPAASTTCVRATFTNDCGGNPEWTYASSTDSCFTLIRGTRMVAAHRMVCMSMGADLASIHNDQENDMVVGLIRSAGLTGFVYIGLQGIPGRLSAFEDWTDGTPLDFTRWMHGQPSGNGACVYSCCGRSEEIRWDDTDCAAQVDGGAVCKRPARHFIAGECVPEVTITTSDPPRTTTAPCIAPGGTMQCPNRWTLLGRNCYMAVSQTGDWDQLNALCASLGANMISMHSVEERNVARRLAVDAGVPSFYIGLRGSANFTTGTVYDAWSDGTIIDFSNFQFVTTWTGTRNTNCIADRDSDNRTWLDVECTTLQPGTVCKRMASCGN